ncbi:MAG: hypothetical protein ACI9IP_002043 [Arcticibacterium sp.]|jgi:hypothetical protein
MKIGFFILFLGLVSFVVQGQQKTISLDLQNSNVEEFVRSVESQSAYYFYYDQSEFDSLIISISVNDLALEEVLISLFENSDFHYAFDSLNVFLKKGRSLSLEILPDLFNRKGSSIPKDSIKEIEDERATWENKLYHIGDSNPINSQAEFEISGFIRNAETLKPMIGASVYIENPRVGTTTNADGFYKVSLPKGRQTLRISSVGLSSTRRQIYIHKNGVFNIDWGQTALILDEVIITAQKESNTQSTKMGVQKVEMQAIKRVPVVFGEADVLKVVTTLPGVKTTGEASTGLNVRGGSTDQNLILFNDAPVYNPSHFFGMFSAFNPEVIESVELYKSSIPAQYGGRLASVLNINSREGSKEKFQGSAGIGLLTSRLNIEGPLNKGKTSFILGGRTTYANWLLDKLPEPYKGSTASFYDLNLDISHEINEKNNLYFSGYLSDDSFNLNSDTLFEYGNRNFSFRWRHIYNDKLTGSVSTGYTNYFYKISSENQRQTAYKLGFDINQSFFKAHFNYYLSDKHNLDFGVNSLYYKLHPGSYLPLGNESLVLPDEIPAEQALETAIYLSDAFSISDKLMLDAGIRFSVFNYLGPHDVAQYAEGLPRTEINLVNTINSKGGIIKTYGTPEYRASLRYAFNNNFSVKAGFNTQQQYIHSISNTASIAPTDVWKLSDTNIKPQSGNQISIGVYNNLKSSVIETSVELYYKSIKNFLDYKSGAQLTLNHHLETDVISTKGKAYGAEFLIKKVRGKLNGWLSYTWSRILLKQDDPIAGELINQGQFYPANYDKPHDITLIGNYRFTKRFSASFNASYSTGRPLTLPAGVYTYAGSVRTLYLERNGHRIPDYFRADFSMNLDGNHKIHQKFHNFWTFGVYNLSGRKNPYSVYYISENGQTNGYKLSIFGTAIPFINFNIKF